MKALVDEFSDLAHSGGDLLFAQNGAWILEKLSMVAYLDGWNREGRHRSAWRLTGAIRQERATATERRPIA